MPEILTLETPVGLDWKLSHQLRGFFVQHVGKSFRFNQALRDFFKHQCVPGLTLSDALTCYRESLKTPTEIGKQFKYNQHMRDYFLANPKASLEEARKAWWEKRGQEEVVGRI